MIVLKVFLSARTVCELMSRKARIKVLEANMANMDNFLGAIGHSMVELL